MAISSQLTVISVSPLIRAAPSSMLLGLSAGGFPATKVLSCCKERRISGDGGGEGRGKAV